MKYLRNCWYLAAWADELPAGGMLPRRFMDEPVALFRNGDGVPHALLDRCPHRFAPLSRGTVSDGAITCRYHGLSFSADGRCIGNPHGPTPKGQVARAFPVREAHRAIWIWMGEPERADVAQLPLLDFMDTARDSAFNKGYLLGSGHYQLFVDNIIDLTHTDYLHADTLGGGALTRSRPTIKETENDISVEWSCPDETPTPLLASLLGYSGARVDSWTKVTWTAPAIIRLHTGATKAGSPREQGGTTTNIHVLTPETERSTHYFFASTRDFAVDDAAVNARIAEVRTRIFATEDEPMIAAQQSRLGDADFWDLKPLLLPADAAAVRIRRRMDRMIARERAR